MSFFVFQHPKPSICVDSRLRFFFLMYMHVYVFIHTCRIMYIYIYIYTYLFCVGIEALFLRGLNLECPL